MKNILFIIIFIAFGSAVAQTSLPPPLMLQHEIDSSMKSVCKIDENSRQCEIIQYLAAKNSEFASKNEYMKINSNITPQMMEYLISNIKDMKILISEMESARKLQTSQLYKIIDMASEKICDIKFESQACMQSISLLDLQASIETGKKLNPPANIPLELKQATRKLISEEHPDLYPSGRLLIEAVILSKMQDEQLASASTPEKIQNKKINECRNKYSPHYGSKKCQ